MERPRYWVLLVIAAALLLTAHPARSAYQHMGEQDSGIFLSVYPGAAGTKLDSCTLCHKGASSVGSCQYCHQVYGYDASGDILETLNPYGFDYLTHGRNAAALTAIASHDPDEDFFTSGAEIAALRYPGDPTDDPTKVPAPYRVYSKLQLEALPQHTQFLLMNASKSTDNYAEYTGVTVENVLADAGMLPSATGIKVFAPDGFSQYNSLAYDPTPGIYPVYGAYSPAVFHYDEAADVALNPSSGWCDYGAPSAAGRNDGDPITVPDGLRLLLAIKRDGAYLTPGVLNAQNKLDGEGPFRVVPPQKIPGPPDQRSTSSNPSLPWPYDRNADHNAGFSTRTATIIKVEPLPKGTTDINTYEAGWPFVDQEKFMVYGAIDPLPTIREKIGALSAFVLSIDPSHVSPKNVRETLANKLEAVSLQLGKGSAQGEISKIEHDLLPKTDGCAAGGAPDKNDWIRDCQDQSTVYWGLKEVLVLLAING